MSCLCVTFQQNAADVREWDGCTSVLTCEPGWRLTCTRYGVCWWRCTSQKAWWAWTAPDACWVYDQAQTQGRLMYSVVAYLLFFSLYINQLVTCRMYYICCNCTESFILCLVPYTWRCRAHLNNNCHSDHLPSVRVGNAWSCWFAVQGTNT